MTKVRPIPDCIGCGACCSNPGPKWVEVSETDAKRLEPLALDLIQPGDILPWAMKMRPEKESCRCIALAGDIGQDARCSIYGYRPGICRWVERGSDICLKSLQLHKL